MKSIHGFLQVAGLSFQTRDRLFRCDKYLFAKEADKRVDRAASKGTSRIDDGGESVMQRPKQIDRDSQVTQTLVRERNDRKLTPDSTPSKEGQTAG